MKIKYIAYILLMIITGLSSCIEDEGNNTLSPINEISISGIEEKYYKVSYAETLTITPEISTSLTGTDQSQLEYRWFISTGGESGSPTHTIIGTEKNLKYQLDIAPGTYSLYFQVLDKTNGLKWEKYTQLNMISQFVRGFYLFGDKEDGTCGIDFVSMMEGRDTTVVENIFKNSINLKGAQNLVFTGPYPELPNISLWVMSESGSYSMEFSSSLSEIDVRKDISPENFIFPTIEVTRPFKVKDIYPHAIGSSNKSLSSNYRLLLTEDEFYSTTLFDEGEAYGNPINRYSASSSELYKPSEYIFYKNNSTFRPTYMTMYDKTNECFVNLNSSFYSATYSEKITDTEGSSFYFDQTKYTPTRTLIYGENGYANGGRSYALMTDSNGKYYVYEFTVASKIPTKNTSREIDLSIATDFGKASHYAFFSEQTIILYSVGSQLWAYDYSRKDAKMVKDFGSEITFLAMDYNSNDQTTDFIVATYSPTEKGVVSKFTIADDQNKIEVTPHEKEVWKTNLKVVKVEYRNASI